MRDSIGIISQARMGSTRLPGKVLKLINGKSILDYHIERLVESGYTVYLATTQLPQDDILEEYALRKGIPYFRGDEHDVLSRYAQLALKYNLSHIVRVTSDCPLIDGRLILEAINCYLEYQVEGKNIFLSNTIERTFPRGFDFEIFSTSLLLEAHSRATNISDREHVTPFIWGGKTPETEIIQFKYSSDKSIYRLTVDTIDDFELIKLLIQKYNCHTLSSKEIVRVMDDNPYLFHINKHIEQKKIKK